MGILKCLKELREGTAGEMKRPLELLAGVSISLGSAPVILVVGRVLASFDGPRGDWFGILIFLGIILLVPFPICLFVFTKVNIPVVSEAYSWLLCFCLFVESIAVLLGSNSPLFYFGPGDRMVIGENLPTLIISAIGTALLLISTFALYRLREREQMEE